MIMMYSIFLLTLVYIKLKFKIFNPCELQFEKIFK